MAAMMMAGTSLKAQEITIVLNPGWTWISCPSTDTLDFTTAFGSFTPAIGDIIKSKWGAATYTADGQWRGSVSLFYPGYGYHYKSNRTEPVIVTFNAQQPAPQVVITTLEPADITTISTIVGGTVTLNEGNHVYACGVCWDTVQMPTVNGNHTSNDANAGTFTDTLTELSPNTIYYLRAYVVTDYGLAYGNEQSFTTLDNNSNVPEGAISGLFTINENGDQVYFSKGNLQYIGSATVPYWKFAENQWDYFGTTTGQNSSDENIDRDLFGWGTSGYNHGAVCYQPWSTSTNLDDYFAYNIDTYNLYDQTGQADWGYNAISNGDNMENNGWRTLTNNEWTFICYTRVNAALKRGHGYVNGIKGVILIPDEWTLPDGLDFISGNSSWANVYSAEQWGQMETNGAVFLPASGCRDGEYVGGVGSKGYYWSSSSSNAAYAYNLLILDSTLGTLNSSCRDGGYSVRLVKDYNP